MESLRLTANAYYTDNYGYLRKSVNGLSPNDFLENISCDDCKLGKQLKIPCNVRDQEKDLWIGQVLHFELTGEMQLTPGGSKYCLVVVDEKSNYVRLVFLQDKGDTSREVIKMNKWFAKQTGNKVARIHSDQQAEFMTMELDRFLERKIIDHEISEKFTTNQNGRVQRQIGRIKDLARTMLIQSGLSKKFWAESCNTAAYVLNRTITRNNYEKTPYHQVFRKVPTLQHLRIFGSTAYYHAPQQKRRNTKAMSRTRILVGYGNDNNYRIWDPKFKSVIIAHDATFNEHYVKYVPLKFERPEIDQWGESDKEEEDVEYESREGESEVDTDEDDAFDPARETTPPITPPKPKRSPQTPVQPVDEQVTPLASPKKDQLPGSSGTKLSQQVRILIEDENKDRFIADIPAGTKEVKVVTKSGRNVVPPNRFQSETKEKKSSTSSIKSDSGKLQKPKTIKEKW